MIVLTYLTVVILCFVSLLHLYWAFGGRWGGRVALPETKVGAPLFRPRMPETIAVAVLLLAICCLLLAQSEAVPFWSANAITKWGCIVCAAGFLLRVIGDFRYVGLFKRIKGTPFAAYDTRLYIPLCFYLAVSLALPAV